MGGASLPVDASLGRKRQRGGGDSTNNDADNDRASKRSRKEGKAKEDTASQRGPASDEPRRSNRDRNSGDGSNWWQTTAASTTTAAGSPAGPAAKTTTKSGKTGKAGREKIGKPGRPAKSAVAAEATESTPANKTTKATKAARAEKAAVSADASTDKPRRGRPRASHSSTEAAAEPPTTNSPAPKKPKKAKTGTAKSPRANKKNKKSGASVAAGSSPTIASPQPRPRAKPQPRQTVEEGEEQEAEDNEEEEADNDDDDDDDDLQQPFRQLVPRTRLVPLATMTNKWAPLDRDAIAAVQSLLDECARPVLARLGSSSEKKDRQDIARQAVAGVTRRLRSKLVKGIPFPTDANGGKSKKVAKKQLATMPKAAPATDVSFLSEPTAETHALQSQLTPLQHAVALLASERRREEAALADEYAQLRALETNAQAELRTWRERQRRQHVLADGSHRGHNDARNASGSLAAGVSRATVGPGQDGQAQAAKDNKDSKDSRDETNGLFSDSFDSSAVDLTSLGNHMESVRANLQQIDGVVAAMARSRAALQDVLGERLSGDQYERVLLGR